jgi:hypothetical protein
VATVLNLVDELHHIAARLEQEAIPYALCGGIAVTVHAAVRTTKDIDLLVRRADLPPILDAVRTLGYSFAALPRTFEQGTPRERHLQRVTKIEEQQHLILDLMLDEGVLACFLEDTVRLELPAGPLRLVSRAVLIRMKRLADRHQDCADLEKLQRGDAD